MFLRCLRLYGEVQDIRLATALGLRKRGIENVLVVDQTRAFRQVGQTIDLLPNGLKASTLR